MSEEVKKNNPAEAEKEEVKESEEASFELPKNVHKEMMAEDSKETKEASLESSKARQKEVAEKEQRVNQQLETLWTSGKQQILGQQPLSESVVRNEPKAVDSEQKQAEVVQEAPVAELVINEPAIEHAPVPVVEKTSVEEQSSAVPEKVKTSEQEVHTQVPAEYEQHELVSVKNGDKELIKKG